MLEKAHVQEAELEKSLGSKANIWPFRLSDASQIASYHEVIPLIVILK